MSGRGAEIEIKPAPHFSCILRTAKTKGNGSEREK
jgi:hypothetical protein